MKVVTCFNAKQTMMACAIRLALPVLAASPLAAGPALGQTQGAEREFDIPAGPLSSALVQLAYQAGLMLSTEAVLTEGKTATALRGRFTIRQALDRLLAGSGLDATVQGGTLLVRRAQASGAAETALAEVRVSAAADPGFGETRREPGGMRAEFQTSSTKSPLSIRETPQAISVITRDSMDQRHVRDANQALELAAGVVSGHSGQGGPFAGRGLSEGENFNIRGQELNPMRDIRIDGFAASSAAFDMAAFERIEAVKGPSSMLYGQGSLGGFINLVRRKPQAELAANAALQLGSFDSKRLEGDVTGALGGGGSLRGRLTVALDDAGSFTDGVKTKTGMIAPSLEALVGERTRVLLQMLYQDDQYIPSQGMPLRLDGSRAHAPSIPRSLFVGLPSQEQSTSSNSFNSLRVDHELSRKWLATVFLQSGKQKMHRIFDSYGYDFTGLATGDIGIVADTAQIENKAWAGELRLDGKFNALGREHRVLLGVERNQRKNRTAFGYTTLGTANLYAADFAALGTIPGGGGNQPFDVDVNTTSDNSALYGQVILSLAERTKLIAGVRRDSSRQERFDNLAGAAGDSKTDKATTMRLGLTQELTRNITAYASYAESFNPVDAISVSGEILDPETGKGFEVGLKTEWLQKRLGASVALYRQDLNNRPITDFANPLFSISSGKQRTDGLELEIAGSPYRGLTIGVAAAWMDAKFIDPLDPDFGLVPYDSVDRMSTLFASYEMQSGVLQGFGFGVTLVDVGKRSLSSAGSGAFYGNGSDAIFVDGHHRADLNFYYKGIKNLSLSLLVRNVTDEVYIERVRDVSGSNYFGSPRAVMLRAKYDFR